jgi:membrane protease YdiL (CAAX protease family)
MTELSFVDLAELALHLAGIALLWRLVLSPAARAQPPEVRLARWEISPLDFAVLLWAVLAAMFIGPLVAQPLLRSAGASGDAIRLGQNAAAQMAMITVCLVFRALPAGRRGYATLANGGVMAGGGAAFVIAMPVVLAAGLLWTILLNKAGLPVSRQELVEFFVRLGSPWLQVLLALSAAVLAPIVEELVFRAGLFGFLRTRVPRWLALVATAALFALMHLQNWETLDGLSALVPLAVLSVVLCYAYDVTGDIRAPMLAHALFNLNTLFVLLLDPPK